MKRLAFVTAAAVLVLMNPPSALSQAPVADPKAQHLVRVAMEQFAKAVLTKDRGTLERLMGSAILYSHSNGHLDTKASFIESVMSEKPKYEGFEYGGDTTFLMYGSFAVVRGSITVKDILEGKHRTIELNAMQIWEKGPQGWVMIARQSTRMNP